MGLIDWMADKVQSMTGEKERRNLVSEIKSVYNAFQTMVIEKINTLNGIIDVFSDSVNDHGINKQKYRKTGNILLPALR